jgi:hypothetical protein
MREAIRAAGLFLLGVIAIIVVAILSAVNAPARWKPEYAALPQDVRDWYASRELTEAAQKRFSFKSCCNNSDVVKTKFRVGGAGQDEWWWLNGDKWERIPDDVIHWNEHAPGGEPVLFAIGNAPTCFFPPDGGI